MEVREVPIGRLIPSSNLRTEVMPDIAELRESIRELGLLQPIRVRPLNRGTYQIIAGHRRTQAFRELGADSIPAVVVEESDEDAAVQSIVENLQREDLTPLELARGVQQLVRNFPLNIGEISRRISKSPERIRTWSRISNLPDDVLERLESGESHGTQRVTRLAPRHIEPFVRDLPSPDEAKEDTEKAVRYEDTLSDVRELQDEVERRNVRINAHMADAIARETRSGDISVTAAMDKVLAEPEQYRYRPPTSRPVERKPDSFNNYRQIHSELVGKARQLKADVAADFSDQQKIELLELMEQFNDLLVEYTQTLESVKAPLAT